MAYENKTDGELALDLADACRDYATHKLAAANSKRGMNALAEELARRLAAKPPLDQFPSDSD